MTENVIWHAGAVSREQRHNVTGGPGVTSWFTGLSGSGKSSVAARVEELLVNSGVAAYTLDGDNIRHGLNADLGFSAVDRAENVRRVGEVARLMADAGLVVLVPVISPYRTGRDAVRQAHLDARIPFAEVHVATPIEVCEKRDAKGLYRRARAGEITGFTGIDDPYEEPLDPELVIGTGESIEESAAAVMATLAAKSTETTGN